MVKFNLFQSKYYAIIISPDKISFLVLSAFKGTVVPITKYEEEARIYVEGDIDRETLSKALIRIKKKLGLHQKEIQAFVILNLPILFIQRFLFYPYETGILRETIETKIKQLIPINLNKYLWEYTIPPLQKNFVYVSFYNKDNISEITYALLSSKILPVKMIHMLHSIFDFIKNNFSLYYENHYQIYLVYQNILTSALYETGMLRNIYTESLTSNINDVLKRLILNNVKDSSLPLDIIYLISDIDFEISEELKNQYKIVNIKEITHLNPEEIVSINVIWNFLFKKESPLYELKIVDLNKELLAYELINSLKILCVSALILFLIINSAVFAITKILENSNKNIKNQQKITAPSEYFSSIEEINQLVSFLAQLKETKEKNIDKIEKIYYNLRDYNINQGFFTKGSAKLIIEIQDPNKREEIKNKIQSLYPQAQINPLFNGLEINLNNY